MKQKTALQLLIEELGSLKNRAYEKAEELKYSFPETSATSQAMHIAYGISQKYAIEKLTLEESQINEAHRQGLLSTRTSDEYFTNTFEK